MTETSPQTITSRDNSLLRLARSVRDGKTPELIFVEGLRLCEEAISSGLRLEAVIYSDEIARKERAARFLAEAAAVCRRLASVSESLLASVSYTKTPQGIIVLARRPKQNFETIEISQALFVILHGLNNPVNVGAIFRSAEGAGASGIIVTANTTDPFSPKALRGAMGSAFRLPVWHVSTLTEALSWCSERGITSAAADTDGETDYTVIDWRRPFVLLVGPEANGLKETELAAADVTIRIPMAGEVESLNVAMATSVVLYEAARQRRNPISLSQT